MHLNRIDVLIIAACLISISVQSPTVFADLNGQRSNQFLREGVKHSLKPSSVSGSPIPQYAGPEWHMFRGDLLHTGCSTSKAPDTNKTLWRFDTGGSIISSPSVVDDMVFVGSEDGNLYCLNATTGSLIWNFTTGNRVWTSPTVDNGKVIFGSNDYNVYCLNKTTGNLIWNYTTGSVVASSPSVDGDRVYIGSNDAQLYCLDKSTGAKIWNHSFKSGPILNAVYSSPAIYGNNLYIGSADNTVRCINKNNGSLIWKYTAEDDITASPAIGSSALYVGSYDSRLYCLPLIDPNDDGIISENEMIWNFTTSGQIYSSPALFGGYVFFGSRDYKVYCLNATTGVSVWNFTVGDAVGSTEQYGVVSSFGIADGKVFVNAWDRNLYCLDVDGFLDGTDDGIQDSNVNNSDLIWSYRFKYSDYGGVSSPTIAYGRVYVGADDCGVYCLGEEYPHVLTSLSISPGYAVLDKVGDIQTFTAAALDQYGKEIKNQTYFWNVTGGIGFIFPPKKNTTLFTATALGAGRVVVSTTYTGVTKEAAANISIGSGTLQGKVLSWTTGEGINCATVTISQTGMSTTTSGSGDYTISKVPAGSFDVTASANGFQNNTTTATIGAGNTTVLDIFLKPVGGGSVVGKVMGKVMDPTGNPLEGVQVKVSAGGGDYTATTDSSGNYQISNVPSGHCTVKATKKDYTESSQDAVVPERGVVHVNFTLTGSTSQTITIMVAGFVVTVVVIMAVVAYILILKGKKKKKAKEVREEEED